MSKPGDIKLDYLGIGSLLSGRNVRVPRYQRSYAWEESHVADFLRDIQAAMADNEAEYFLGSIVATGSSDDQVEVVDGQQRLATTAVLIAAVRDWYVDNGDIESAVELERDFLMKKDRRSKDLVPKLTLNDVDHGYFLDGVLLRASTEERESAEASTPSHKRLYRASTLAAAHVAELVDKTKQPVDRLNDLVDYLQNNVKVIWLRAADEANAFTIFETLNDRGLELATSDLLKNYLFSMAGDRIGEVQKSWIAMSSALERVSDDRLVTEFIRHYWSSHYGATRKQVLYESIKQKTRTKSAAVALAKDLERASSIYAAMLNLEDDVWKTFGKTARGHMATINDLGMVQIRPLVLAVLDKGMSVKEARKTLRRMVSWGVRFLIAGGLGGGTLERHYSEAARQVRDKKALTASALAKALAAVLPSDGPFEQAFATARVSKASLARYYLQALELKRAGNSQPELVPNPNPDEVNLEHVLPKSLSSGWRSAFDVETHATYYRRIGNMCLMAKAENTATGADQFSKKKPAIKKSRFVLTEEIAEYADWTTTEIEDRQRKLAALAVATWPL